MQRLAIIYTLIVVSFSLALAATPTCSVTDERILKRRRIQGLRASILAQLGLNELPKINTSQPVPREIQETYDVIVAAGSSLRGAARAQACESREIYAQPVSAFVGSIEVGSASTTTKRSAENHLPSNIVDEFAINFNFNLPENLTDILRAELLLYKVSPPHPTPDNLMYIEIKVIAENIGLKTVVSSKYVNPLTEGYEAFNIMPAISIWLSQSTKANVTLLASIHCLSSIHCGAGFGEGERLRFKDYDAHEKAPRIIVTSRNPLEFNRRSKRQTVTPGVADCVSNQSTCCLKKLKIDFHEDLGMTFVKTPKVIDANYCEGICPIYQSGDLMTPELYDILSKLHGSPASSVEPCCASNTFNDVTLIMQVNESQFVIDTMKQLEVTSCRCA